MHEKTKIEGYLLAFSEQGTEGSHWSLQESKNCGYEGLHVLKEGSFLRVFNDEARSNILWEGNIDLERESHIKDIFMGFRAQWLDSIGTVHGIQRNIDPDKWAKMFVEQRPAEFFLA